MKSIHKVMRLLAVAVLVAGGFAAKAEAIPIVSINPPSQSVPLGPVTADIIVSGLTEAVGGFEAVLSFDDTILEGTGYTIGADLGAGLDFSLGFTGGNNSPLDLFFTSLETGATLTANQGPFPATVVLATINFNAVANGVSPLNLSKVVLTDVDGFVMPSGPPENGKVCVGQPCQIPEPGLMALLAAGLATAAARRRVARPRV